MPGPSTTKTPKNRDWFPPEPVPPEPGRRARGRGSAATRKRRAGPALGHPFRPGRLLAVVAVELLIAAAVLIGLFARSAAPPPSTPRPRAAVSTPAATLAPSAAPSAAPRPSVWLPALPAALDAALRAWAASRPADVVSSDPGRADLIVSWEKPAGGRQVAEVVLVPVVALPVEREGVALDELRDTWRGRAPAGGPATLLVTPETGAALVALWGAPPAQAPVVTVPAADVAGRLWAAREAVALIPFERLEPRLKALPVDGRSALDRDLATDDYPLCVSLWAGRSSELARALAADLQARGLDTNRRPEHLTTLAMTGVTALARHLALAIDARGDDAWPARQIAPVLSAADLTHISNEVSFQDGCVPQADTTAFCARPGYMATLRLIGADLVELTGNHNLDFGPEPALYSLDLYAAEGMRTFGGGRDAAEARRPLIVEHNGNRLAFLGYNPFGPGYAWATADSPGAAAYSLDAVTADIAAVRPEADLVFVNLQYEETYSTTPLYGQIVEFRAIVAAGADVVTGSQAHQPQAVEFRDGRPIFYGLGNLFFDQTWSDATRQSLIIRHVVYEGRLIGIDLLPTVMGDDYQPRLAEGEERRAILRAVFEAGEALP